MDLQLDALEEVECERIYKETTSGAAKSRPELERCLEELREDDTLVVWRLDRFGRSLKDLVSKMETLEEQGVDFVSLTEGIDTTTAQGRLTFHIFGALAEFERELAHERTMAGLKAARERGRVGGRPRALDEDEIPQIQSLMQNPDVSTAQICERFGISKATLYRYVGPNGGRRR
jgi:DNA invertase Pin-like site-specific DNA recombinase